MYADVDYGDGVLDITFSIKDASLNSELSDLLKFQLERLKLNERYPRQINKFLFEQRTAILMFKDVESELAKYFLRSAKFLSQKFGRNDWRPALLRALAANKMFCVAPEDYFGNN